MLFFLIITGLIELHAQDHGNCREIKNKEAREIYKQAIGILHLRPKDAYDLLQRAVGIEPRYVDAYYIMAETDYLQANRFAEGSVDTVKSINLLHSAKLNYKKVIEYCPSFNHYFAYYYLGDICFKLHEYSESRENLQNFITNNKTDFTFLETSKDQIRNIDDYFKILNNPVPFNPAPLEGINTSDDEYLPLLSPDGDNLFYSRRFKKNPSNETDPYIEEFMYSKKYILNDSLKEYYEAGVPMLSPFNEGKNQGGATITIDNKHLYITICDFERANYTSYKNCDIYSSDFHGGKWTPLKRLGPNINNVNTFEGQPSITADGKELYFASNREGGYGGLDIYRSVREPNGEWEKAQNLGPIINTTGNDKTPFIHSDSHTLYFSTDGRFGMGGYDIYYSQNLVDETWTTPKNIGYPINTKEDELGFIVSADGKKIYFSSNKLKGKGGWDIYSSPLYKQARPERVLFVKGKIVDDKGSNVDGATVELTNVQTKESTEGLVDKITGNYAVAIAVKPKDEFIMTTKKEGYFFDNQYINPLEKKFEPPTTLNIQVIKIKTDLPIRLENVTFATNSAILNEVSKTSIDQLIDFMIKNKNILVELRGHTDNEGTTEKNLILSKYRADAVKNYLLSKGIKPERIYGCEGYGDTMPNSPNNTIEGKAMNRRVEFLIKK